MSFNLTLIGETIAMIVFVWVTMRFIWPPLMGMIETRQREIAEGIAAAEKGRNSLEDAKTESQTIVAAARDQARSIVDQANSRANEIVEQAKAEGAAEKARQLEGARAEIGAEVSRARDELRGQVAAIAIAGAERILSREINADTHRDLLDRLAAEL